MAHSEFVRLAEFLDRKLNDNFNHKNSYIFMKYNILQTKISKHK